MRPLVIIVALLSSDHLSGASTIADGVRANKRNGGRLTQFQFNANPEMTDAGMTAIAEAMHEAGLATDMYTPTKVVDAIAALTKQDNAETIDLSGTNAKIEAELGNLKREFTERAIAYRNDV